MTPRSLVPLLGMAVAGLMTWLTLQGEEQLAAVVVFGFLAVCGIALLIRGPSAAQRPLGLFLLAFGVRVAAAVAVYEGGLVSLLGDEDSQGWSWGWTLSQVWRGRPADVGSLPTSILGAFGGENRGYVYLVATLLLPLDIPSRLAVAFMSAFFGALTVALIFMIAERLFDREVARIAGLLAAFFPSLIVWSAQTLKEPIVIFCECLILYAVIRLRQAFSPRHLLYALLGILLVSTMRFYVAYLSLGVLAAGLLMPRFGVSNRSFAAGLALLTLAIPLLGTLGFLERTGGHMQSFSLGYIDHYRKASTVGPGSGSAVRLDVDVKTPVGAVVATGVGVAHLMLAPFPWQLGKASVRMLMTLPELILWWWLLLRGVLPGLIHALRTRFTEIQPMLLFIVPLSLLYGIMFTNIGLVFRQRAQLLPFYLVFAALGLVIRRRRRVERWIARVRQNAEGSNRWRQRVRRPETAPPVEREAEERVGAAA